MKPFILAANNSKCPSVNLRNLQGPYVRKPCGHLMDILRFQISGSNIIKIPIPSTFSYKLNAISIRIRGIFFPS